jgi:hypothetical protein
MLLSLSALKIGSMRLGQLSILGLFALIMIDDYNHKKIDFKILFYFLLGAVLMALISKNSIYGKVDETKYIIKYMIIFPATFYIGAKIVEKITLKDIVNILDITVFIYFLVAYLVYLEVFPNSLDFLLRYRNDGFGGELYLEFQGTFDEAGTLAMITYLMVSISFLIRFEFNIWYKNRVFNNIFYLFVFISLIMTRNKTIWVALLGIIFSLVVLKMFFMLIYSNRYQPKYILEKNRTLKMFQNINSLKLITFFIFILVSLYIANQYLLSEPLITEKLLQKKLSSERGKAFVYAIKLLKESDWLGGYGFGFVEYYFSHLNTTIIGLGKGVGMIFNSYLDLWISVSFIGVFFHLGLLYMSFSKEYFLTMILPLTLLIYNNFNPFIADEYYYILLGLVYGFTQKYVLKRIEYR